MERVRFEDAGFYVAELCRRIDEGGKEVHRINGRGPVLWVGALLAWGGIVSILRGKDAELLRMFGEGAYTLSFGGFVLCAGWAVRDIIRRRALRAQTDAAYRELGRRGYEYWDGVLRGSRKAGPSDGDSATT